MTTEEFMTVWGDTELRQYIIDYAKQRSKRIEIQEEFVQEAWLAISLAPGGHSADAYKPIAYKVIRSSYWQHRKECLLYEQLGGIQLTYSTNPFDPDEVVINHKVPKRRTSDHLEDDDPADEFDSLVKIPKEE